MSPLNTTNLKSSSPCHTPSGPGRLTLDCLVLSTALLLGSAHAEETAAAKKAVETPAPTSRVNALFNMEFSNKYLTPRGMIVQDDGLVFQPLLLGFFNVYKEDTFISDATLVGGVWNCFGTSRLPSSDSNGRSGTSWYEIDPIAGVSFSFAKNFKLDVTYTAFNMQILNIPFSQHLQTRLLFNDAPYLGKFALNPYVLFWQELEGKATAAQVPFFAGVPKTGPGSLPDSSYYFETGIAPSYTFASSGLKVEAPCRVLLPGDDFYGEYYDESSTVGLYELGLKATLPMNFMPQGYGHWSAYVGAKYMKLVDNNLASMQEFNAPGHRVTDTTQVYGGVTIFF